jgi:uncharacterized protein (TIGR03663 family)
MSTVATKSTNSKKARALASMEATLPSNQTRTSSLPFFKPEAMVNLSERTWLIACTAVMLIGVAIRFYSLELKPMHHDEGVNGFFLTNLLRQGIYHYDPTNYHGPTLYYLAAPAAAVLGLKTFSVRLVVALFGVATIFLILTLRRHIGSLGAIIAAALVALSPGATYYSRYFIHETLFVFFTVAIVISALRYYESGRALYLLLATASAALLFATKETAFVSIITLGLAWYVARRLSVDGIDLSKYGRKIFGMPRSERTSREKRRSKHSLRPTNRAAQPLERFGGRDRLIILGVYCIGLFLVINVLFYSSFFTNWPGVRGALDAMKVWAGTGTSEFHGKPFDTYLKWLFLEEAPIFLLAIIGSLIAVNERANRFALFAAAWAFGILAAYSLIPYKTPWLMLSFIVPMAIVAGYGVQQLSGFSWRAWKAPFPAFCVAALALALCGYQSFILNFREYDNDQYPYVYSHSHRELLSLVSEVEKLQARAGGQPLGITIASPEYWPLPWYFRDNPNVAYAGSVSLTYNQNEVPVVIGRESADAKEDQTQQLQTTMATNYQKVGTYTLRPGVRLAVFARPDLVK